ncbi:MAG: esterase-like activity of phytase family protein [Novosphingobium sp.]
MRRLAILLLLLGLAPGTWLRTPPVKPSYELALRLIPLPLPPRALTAPNLGPFELEAIWQVKSPHFFFGGFSALLPLGEGRMLAVSDLGWFLRFSMPGSAPGPQDLRRILNDPLEFKTNRDAESATQDAASGDIWIATEGRNAVMRYDAELNLQATAYPPAMHGWSINLGPEAMTRLADGRFVVLQEAFTGWTEQRRHGALLFAGDPVSGAKPAAFLFDGPERFSPVDMAQLPDGRALILMRRLVWPMPFRFAGRIAIADPAEIRTGGVWRAREVAKLSSQLPVDNFEGIAVEPREDGRLTVWLISDDNQALSQRTLLWKMVLDPAKLE